MDGLPDTALLGDSQARCHKDRKISDSMPEGHLTLCIQCELEWAAEQAGAALEQFLPGGQFFSAEDVSSSNPFIETIHLTLCANHQMLSDANPTEHVFLQMAPEASRQIHGHGDGVGVLLEDVDIPESISDGVSGPSTDAYIDEDHPMDLLCSEGVDEVTSFADPLEPDILMTNPTFYQVDSEDDWFSASSYPNEGDIFNGNGSDMEVLHNGHTIDVETRSDESSVSFGLRINPFIPDQFTDDGRTSLQPPLPQNIEMQRFLDDDRDDYHSLEQAIAMAEDRVTMLEAQVLDVEEAIARRIDLEMKAAKGGLFASISGRIRRALKGLVNLFGACLLLNRKQGDGYAPLDSDSDDEAAPHGEGYSRYADPAWEVMDIDAMEAERTELNAKLDDLEAQINNMRNTFSRKMLTLLADRLVIAHEIMDQQRH